MAKVIVITSGKGGVGKTTTTSNIGVGLALKGKKVLMIDTDIGLRNLDVVMGLENRIVYDLVDVVEERCRIAQALIKDKRCSNLCLLPAAQIRDKNDVNPEQMKNLIEKLRKDADRIIGLLEANDIRSPKLIVNRIKMDMVKAGNMLSVDDMLDILAIELIGVVPDDENIVISTNRGEPLIYKGESLAAQAYKNIVERVEGKTVPFLDLDVKLGFFDKLKMVFSQ